MTTTYTPIEHTCPSCGSTFWKDQPWKRVCLDCWREEKAQEQEQEKAKATQGKGPSPLKLLARILELEGENTRLRREIEIRRSSLNIPPDMLARLIRLAHPDRHSNSEAANKATTWLLQQRQQHQETAL
jgi:uncharacterized Zn ribbon protein